MIGPYLEVIRRPHAARLAGTTFAFGLTVVGAMVPMIFFTRDVTGSFGRASVVLAADAVGQALSSPVRGRLIDRHGARRTLPLFALAMATMVGVLIAAGRAGASLGVLAAIAFLFGTATQTPGGVLRSIWPAITEGVERSTAFAFLTVMHEMTNLLGPLLGALLLVVASPTFGLAASVGAAAIACVLFAYSPGVDQGRPGDSVPRWSLGPLVSPGFRVLLAMAFFYGITFGALEDIALPAFATEHGSRAAAGILLGAIALGIGVGGFAYGLRKWRDSPGALIPALSAVGLIGLLPALLASSVAVMAIVMVVFGLAIAPISTLQFAVIDDVSPPGSGTEAFGWLTSAATAGAAFGAIVAGKLVDGPGVDAALTATAVAAAFAFLTAFAGRRPLATGFSPGSSREPTAA